MKVSRYEVFTQYNVPYLKKKYNRVSKRDNTDNWKNKGTEKKS